MSISFEKAMPFGVSERLKIPNTQMFSVSNEVVEPVGMLLVPGIVSIKQYNGYYDASSWAFIFNSIGDIEILSAPEFMDVFIDSESEPVPTINFEVFDPEMTLENWNGFIEFSDDVGVYQLSVSFERIENNPDIYITYNSPIIFSSNRVEWSIEVFGDSFEGFNDGDIVPVEVNGLPDFISFVSSIYTDRVEVMLSFNQSVMNIDKWIGDLELVFEQGTVIQKIIVLNT